MTSLTFIFVSQHALEVMAIIGVIVNCALLGTIWARGSCLPESLAYRGHSACCSDGGKNKIISFKVGASGRETTPRLNVVD